MCNVMPIPCLPIPKTILQLSPRAPFRYVEPTTLMVGRTHAHTCALEIPIITQATPRYIDKEHPSPMTPLASLLTASKFWPRNRTPGGICKSALGYATASTPKRRFSQCRHLQHQHPPLRILFCGSDHFSATSL